MKEKNQKTKEREDLLQKRFTNHLGDGRKEQQTRKREKNNKEAVTS